MRVAQSLSSWNGDLNSYDLLSDLVNGKYGKKRDELERHKTTLGKRLNGHIDKSARQVSFAADIRTGGGAF